MAARSEYDEEMCDGEKKVVIFRSSEDSRLANRIKERLKEKGGNKVFQIGGNKVFQLGGNKVFQLGGNKVFQLGGNKVFQLGGNKVFQLGGNEVFQIGGNKLGGNEVFQIGGNKVFQLGGNKAFQLGGNKVFQLGGNKVFQLDGNKVFQLGDNKVFQLGDNKVFQLGGNEVFQLGGNKVFQLGGNKVFQLGGNKVFQLGGNKVFQLGGNKVFQLGGNEVFQLGGNEVFQLGGNEVFQLGGNEVFQLGGNKVFQLGGNKVFQLGGNKVFQLGGNKVFQLGGNEVFQLGGNKVFQLGGNKVFQLGGNKVFQLGGNKVFQLGGNKVFQLGGNEVFQLGGNEVFQLGGNEVFQLGGNKVFQLGGNKVFQLGGNKVFQLGGNEVFRLHVGGIDGFVEDDITPGQAVLDVILTTLSSSRASLFLVTRKAMESSWFALQTILALERSQQRGQFNCVMLLHGVTEDELPKFALFHMIKKYELNMDMCEKWDEEQIEEVIRTIQDVKTITSELPVGNVAHAQAWSHYYGYHDIVRLVLAQRIRDSQWFRENSKNMPIAVYELVPKSCCLPQEMNCKRIKKVGHLEEIVVSKGGNVKRRYKPFVYCIEDGGEKYYCVAQYPNVLSAIEKMAKSRVVDMDEEHRNVQVVRFYYTLHAILKWSNLDYQARLLWFDDSVEDPADVLIEAVKNDIQRTSFDTAAQDLKKAIMSVDRDDLRGTQFDATILYNSDDEDSAQRCRQIEKYLSTKDVRVLKIEPGQTEFMSLDEAVSKVRWLIIIITKDGIQTNDVFKMQTMAILEECVCNKKVRIIPVINKGSRDVEGITPDNIPDFLRWITYIDVQTKGYEELVYQALKGDNIPLVLDAAHVPAGNLGYGLAWGYVVNYLKKVLPEFGKALQHVLQSGESGINVCPDKLYLLVPKTCKCPGEIENEYVKHQFYFSSMDDLQGGANIVKSLNIYKILDDNNIKQKEHYFIGQYPAPLECLYKMNDSRWAGIDPCSMKRERTRFCDTLRSLLWGPVGEGLHNKCELVFYDDENEEDLRRKLLSKIYFDVDREKSQRRRRGTVEQPKLSSRKRRRVQTAMDVDKASCEQKEDVFISYSSEDLDLVEKIKKALQRRGISSFVASSSITAGTPTIDGIVHGINTSRKGLFLVTRNALKSSWFAFETILALERSQQLGKIGALILLSGVTEDQLPKLAMFDMLPRFTMSIDSDGDWTEEQVQLVVETIKEEKCIDCELPVGNVAHAQAWSHYFGFHNIVHTQLEQRIKESTWYQTNPANMPMKMYELVPSSCVTPFVIDDKDVTKVGTLAPIVVNRAGNKTRPYMLNVYSIEDGDQKYYCVAQYPNVLSAIRKMEDCPMIQMDQTQRELQVARFYYTLNAILHHSDTTPCHNQSRLLYFDDRNERARDVLLRAIRHDVENAPLEAMAKDQLRLPTGPSQTAEYDVVILYSNADSIDGDRKNEIERYLTNRRVKVHPDVCKRTETYPLQKLEDAIEKCRWVMLIITRNCTKDAVMNMKIMALLGESISSNRLRIIPVIDDLSEDYIPEMLRWVTYIDMRTAEYQEQIYRALKGESIPLALDAAHIPAGNLGYGLAWGFVVNYLRTVLPQFGPHLKEVLDLKGDVVTACPERIYLLVPRSCMCTGLISDRWAYVEHFSSFARISENLGGANVIKSLDIYSIKENDNKDSKKHYFIGQYPTPILCLWEMNDCRLAGINEDAMVRESRRFCDTLNSLLSGPVGEGLSTKCELVHFNDSDPEDLRRQLLPHFAV
ncbi:uncharacterized protein LOC117341910 [Pecten maximus]|uniref:uncharacterized protein LOC117341910 n=1 Tax=Pecten maximus TaxID=6579 RepID=UPI0014583B1B|nr:uncharacterized protein LOC117341910 [Pecten maximus]